MIDQDLDIVYKALTMMISRKIHSIYSSVSVQKVARRARIQISPFSHQINSGNSVQNYASHDSRLLLHSPETVRTSWVKNVIVDVIPLTSQVISSREGSVDVNLELAVSFCHPSIDSTRAPDQEKQAEIEQSKPRSIDDSWIELILPFEEHQSLRENLMRFDRKTIRHGKLFELLDTLAADVAYRHCGGYKSAIQKYAIVTASVGGMKLFAQIDMNNDLRMQGYVTYVGKSSIEITINLLSTNQRGESIFIGNTHYIMVGKYVTMLL